MTFDECVQSIHKGSVISFKEYTLDRHERKHLSLDIDGAMVQEVFQLSCMNCPRFVVSLGISKENVMDIKILVLNRDFYNMGHQEIKVTNEVSPENMGYEPSYVALVQKGW